MPNQDKTEAKSYSQELAEKYGVADHKNRDELYRLAYDYGHSGGVEEVESYYQDLVVLLK